MIIKMWDKASYTNIICRRCKKVFHCAKRSECYRKYTCSTCLRVLAAKEKRNARGKPFVCWLSSEGHHHDVALHIGDEVEILVGDKWVRGKFGRHRQGVLPYFVRAGRKEHQAALIHKLRPAKEKRNG